ncbi:MAG: hypothetical protein AAF911_00170 [Planctomycetota bacterium]
MSPKDLQDLLDADPFRPFRVSMSDGSSYDVTSPSFAYVTTFALHLGTDFDEHDLPTRSRSLAVMHINQIEELPNESAA